MQWSNLEVRRNLFDHFPKFYEVEARVVATEPFLNIWVYLVEEEHVFSL